MQTTTETTKAPKMTKKAQKEAERAEAIKALKALCPPGTKVYCILRHVSSTGMSRDISLFVIQDGELIPLTGRAATALEWRLVESKGHRAIRVGGCGMDMGFHLVYSLSATLYGYGDDGLNVRSGAYALKHEWL